MKTAFRSVLAAAILGVAGTAAAAPAWAEPPAQVRSQSPGFFRFALGEVEVTALYDGFIDLDKKLLSGAPSKDVDARLAAMFVPASDKGVQTAVNAYLVNTGKNLILIDAGTAKVFGPSLGFVGEHLKAAGYDPAQVDTVLVTHLHGDHVNGLVSPDGKMVFPNATVMVSKPETEFWLNDEVAAKAPEGAKPFFAMAKAAMAPYAAAGRMKTFAPGESPVAGVTSVAAFGHTPGHVGYRFTSKDQTLLMWGDIIHSHAVQFAQPDVALEFDVDKKAAVATRKRLLAETAKSKVWVAGSHLPFPGIGHVRAEGKGYAWVPVEYGPLR